jgi:hypothetical protein
MIKLLRLPKHNFVKQDRRSDRPWDELAPAYSGRTN